MMDRPITRLCRSLIRRSRGNLKIVAIECGVDDSRVSHWLGDEASLPADAIVPFCRGLETVEPLRAMAAEMGMDLVPMAQPASGPISVQEGVWSLLGHTSTVGTEVKQAVADGGIDEAEAERIDKALILARDAIDAMRAHLPTAVTPLKRARP